MDIPLSLKEARDLSLFGLSSSFITTLHGKSHSISTFVAKKGESDDDDGDDDDDDDGDGDDDGVMMVCFHLMLALYL